MEEHNGGIEKAKIITKAEKSTMEQVGVSNNAEKSEPNLENFDTEALIDATRKLIRIFRAREDERLSPIIEPETTSRLMGVCGGLEEAQLSKNAEEISGNLSRLAQLLDGIGRVSVSRTFRENSDNLSKIIHALREIEDAVLVLRGPALGDDLNGLLRRVGDISGQKWLVAAKRRDLVRAYEGRRY